MEVDVRKFAGFVVALGLWGQPAASAQELSYSWEPGEMMHYRLQAYVKAPRVLRFYASENLDARVVELTMGLELDCVADEPGRRKQDWSCGVHRIQLGGMAFEGEQDKLDSIFREYTDILSKATVELEWTLRGQLKTVDIEGFSKRNDREQIRYEYLRLLIMRAVAALELEAPKNANASKKWRQKGSPLGMRLPTRFGTAGGVRLEHEVTTFDAHKISVQSVGRGTVSSGQSIESGVDNAVNISLLGNAIFDAKRGVLLRNELNVQGALNTSSSGATDGFYLSQFVLAEKVDGWKEPEVPVEEPSKSETPEEEQVAPESEAPAAPAVPEEAPAPAPEQ